MSMSLFTPGQVVADKYIIERELAAGGMGRVYTAIQQPMNRKVVLKLMHPELVVQDEMRERFLQEAEAVGRLSHPNTVTVFDYGRVGEEVCFIAMEFIEGKVLEEMIVEGGPLSAVEAARLVIQVAQSLEEAHNKNIIHRDLKPDNIIIGEIKEGVPIAKVLDFGIAKILDGDKDLTQAGMIFGTPSYMAPEQGKGLKLDGRADLYALACCFFFMLTGKPPYEGDTALSVVLAHINTPVPQLPPSIPDPLRHFMTGALAKDPNDRPDNAEAFIIELIEALGASGFGEFAANIPFSTASHAHITPSRQTIPSNAQSEMATPSLGVTAQQEVAPTMGEKKSNMGMIIGGLILLVVLVVGYSLFSNNEGPAAPNTTGTPSPVSVSVKSDPAGATVLINGTPMGKTPFIHEGNMGDTVTISLQKPAFVEHAFKPLLIEKNPPKLYVSMERRRVVLRIVSPLPRAQLFVEGEQIATLLKNKPFSEAVDWPEKDLRLTIKSETHEDNILKIDSRNLDEVIDPDEGLLEWEPDLEHFIIKVPK